MADFCSQKMTLRKLSQPQSNDIPLEAEFNAGQEYYIHHVLEIHW